MKFLFDALQEQHQQFPQDICIAQKESGKWVEYSTQQIVEQSRELAAGFLALGLQPGDAIGIVATNCVEWVITDQAIALCGLIGVPMYPNATSEDYAYISGHAEIKLIFVRNEEMYNKVASFSDKLNIGVYSFEIHENIKYWRTLFDENNVEDQLAAIQSSLREEKMATIIYTSGTTGTPKGVMLSHQNIISNAHAVAEIFNVDGKRKKVLSFLPLCHIFERTALYTYLHLGISIYFVDDLEQIPVYLKEVRPNYFATVPRLLEKIYEKIMQKGLALTGMKKQLFFWALALSDHYNPNEEPSLIFKLKLKLARKLIFSKWKEALGGEVEFIVSGAAALQQRVSRAFWTADIHILEAYGQTESSPGITFTRNDPTNVRIGTVGETLSKIEIKIAEDGEILAKGPNIMLGYYKNEEQSKATINEEGWLHTGDIGELVEGRFLKITDRKKEIFKTSGGKYIAPQPLENKICESLYVQQAMVVGEGEKFPAVLVVVNPETLEKWAQLHKVAYDSVQKLIEDPKVQRKLEQEIDVSNAGFANYERVKKFTLLAEPWTIESNELTPTLKLKRKNILANHQDKIKAFYD